MADAGRKRSVSDERILLEFLLSSDPAMFTSEISANLPLTKQRVNQLLDDMEDKGFVTSKKASGRRLWWMSPRGHEHVADAVRDRLS